jgi:hypothetical protein
MDTGSRPIMTYGEPAITGGSPASKEFLAIARWCARSSASTTARSLRAVRSWGNRPKRAHPGHAPYPDARTIWRAPTDIQYHLHVQQKVELGLAAIEAGQFVSQDEAERRVAEWVKSTGPNPLSTI